MLLKGEKNRPLFLRKTIGLNNSFTSIENNFTFLRKQIQMRPRSSCAVRSFTPVYLHAKTAIDASDIRT